MRHLQQVGTAKNFSAKAWALVSTAAVIAIFSLVCLDSYLELRGDRFIHAREEAERTLLVFEAQSSRTLDYTDGYLRAIRAFCRENCDAQVLAEHIHEIGEPNSAKTFSGVAYVIDRDGFIIFQSAVERERLRGFGSMATLDHFRYFQSHPGDTTFLGATRLGKITGKYQYRLARPILSDGRFEGEVVLTLEPNHIIEFFRSHSLGPHSVIAIMTLDPKLIARQPEPPAEAFDSTLLDVEHWSTMRDQPSGTIISTTSSIDGVRRDIFFKRLADYPAVVLVGIAYEDIEASLAPSRWNLILLALVFAFIALIVCGLVLRLIGRNRDLAMTDNASRHTAALLEQSNAELARHRDDLEDLVRDRTRDLRLEVQERRKLALAVEQSALMIFITDKNGIIEYVNPKFTEITGYEVDEAIGETPRLIKSGETPPEVYKDLWKTILSGQQWRGELMDRSKGGRIFWASISISPVRDESNAITHFVAMHEDITERKLAEKNIRLGKEQAEIASRAKSEILTNMSHELRTPLNAVIGYSETLLAGVFGPFPNPKFEEYINDIHDSGLHLLDVINDILDVSAIDAGKIDLHEESVRLREVVEATIRLIVPRAEKGKVIVLDDVPSDLPRLRADERRLKQIVLNLVSNAVKFTPEGGTVTVSARLTVLGAMEVFVSDTGIGMDEADISKALTVFGQVDSGLSRSHEGTGLGLPLTQGLVELHGGVMAISSGKGVGTTVTVTFPAERIEAKATAALLLNREEVSRTTP
ncbi:putative Histidine kinase [Candidatus Terasakiella magnetica]|nr:putative Histidine kinase [Candidatus Terasakiella magnetica]